MTLADERAVVQSLRTAGQVARDEGVTRQWVTRMARRGGIGTLVGRDWLFLPAEVEQLRRAMRTTQTGRPRKERGDAEAAR